MKKRIVIFGLVACFAVIFIAALCYISFNADKNNKTISDKIANEENITVSSNGIQIDKSALQEDSISDDSSSVSDAENINLLDNYINYIESYIKENPDDNIVISPAALNKWLNLYSNTLEGEDKETLQSISKQDYTDSNDSYIDSKIIIDSTEHDLTALFNGNNSAIITDRQNFKAEKNNVIKNIDNLWEDYLESDKAQPYDIFSLAWSNFSLSGDNRQLTYIKFNDSDKLTVAMAISDGECFTFKDYFVYKIPYSNNSNSNLVLIIPRKGINLSDIDLKTVIMDLKNNRDALLERTKDHGVASAMAIVPYFVYFNDTDVVLEDIGLNSFENANGVSNIEHIIKYTPWTMSETANVAFTEDDIDILKEKNKDKDLFLIICKPFMFYVENGDNITYLGAINRLFEEER